MSSGRWGEGGCVFFVDEIGGGVGIVAWAGGSWGAGGSEVLLPVPGWVKLLPWAERREVMKAVDSPSDWAVIYWEVMDLRQERVYCEVVEPETEAKAAEMRGRVGNRVARKQVGREGRTM